MPSSSAGSGRVGTISYSEEMSVIIFQRRHLALPALMLRALGVFLMWSVDIALREWNSITTSTSFLMFFMPLFVIFLYSD